MIIYQNDGIHTKAPGIKVRGKFSPGRFAYLDDTVTTLQLLQFSRQIGNAGMLETLTAISYSHDGHSANWPAIKLIL